jgi:hypothetical protein
MILGVNIQNQFELPLLLGAHGDQSVGDWIDDGDLDIDEGVAR